PAILFPASASSQPQRHGALRGGRAGEGRRRRQGAPVDSAAAAPQLRGLRSHPRVRQPRGTPRGLAGRLRAGAAAAAHPTAHPRPRPPRHRVLPSRVFLEPLCFIAQSAFLGFAELFNVILSNRYSGLRAVHLQPRLILECIDAIIDNIERGMDYSYEVWNKRKPWSYSTADKEATNFHRQIRACLHFISLTIFYFCSPKADPPPQLHSARVAGLRREVYRPEARPPFSGAYPTVQMDDAGPLGIFIPSRSEHAEMRAMMTPRLLDRFYRQVNRLVRLNPRVRDGQTLVHLACSSTKVVRCDLFPLPHADLIRLLCYLGADPDAIDANGYRPIGTILASRSLQDNVKAEIIATLVRDCGAHYDASVMPPTWLQTSREGDTDSADVKALRWPWGAACQTVVSLSGLRPAALVSLKCLATHALPPAARNCPTLFPEALLTFVRLHHHLA
uniref:ANK_REP_REGION domain-containing protein n=1 Tax=Mesocestoides corti TaxID=53468 RepID=A0A5K3FNW0_MESCO